MLDAQLEKIIKGQMNYQSSNLGLNLLITRMKKQYNTNQTAAQMRSCVNEMNTFFQKYGKVVAADINKLGSL